MTDTINLDEGFKRIETGESERRTTAQKLAGRHVSKALGSHRVDVLHHPKGGLIIQSKKHGKHGNNAHVREMSKHLDALGAPHRYEESERRHADRLYMTSTDAHEHGVRLKNQTKKSGVNEDDTRYEDFDHIVDQPEVATHAADVLRAAALERPADAKAMFADMLRDRIAEFVATRRDDLSQTMFAGPRDEDDASVTDDDQEDLFDTDDEPADEGDGEEVAEDDTEVRRAKEERY